MATTGFKPINQLGDGSYPSEIPLLVKAASSINGGAIVVTDATGYAKKGLTATGLKVWGISRKAVDNSAGASGDKTAIVDPGTYWFKNSSGDPVAQADLGATVYVEDDETFAKTDGTGTRSAGGKLIKVESGRIAVSVGISV